MKFLDKNQPLWKQGINLMLVGLLVLTMCTTAIGMYNFLKVGHFLQQLELLSYDMRVNMPIRTGQAKDHPSPDIMMIMFDDMSFRAYNQAYGTWPWPRSIHADMIHYLNRHEARAMAYDLMFVSRQRDREASDEYFINTFRDSKNVYLSMNFDNELEILRKRGFDPGFEAVERIRPYALEVENRLDPKNHRLSLNHHGFYDNPAMNFDNYREIMRELLAVQERVAFINHGPDADGVSRGNPLIYRFVFDMPLVSEYRPYGREPETGQLYDTLNRKVTPEGYLLDEQGKVKTGKYSLYYPYLAMRLFLDLKFPGEKVKLTLTPDGYLAFKNYRVPLSENGTFLPHWYHRQGNDKPYGYKEIPAWQILDALTREKKGEPPTADDQQLAQMLKGKVIFIGNSSVAGYDIKPTPVNKMMPGVYIQVVTFDTLWRNESFITRIDPYWQIGLTLLMTLLAVFLVAKSRTALWDFIAITTLVLLYVIAACILFKFAEIWIEIMMPLFVMLLTAVIALVVKYIFRNIAYEKTYAMANTDSMTGLHNYNFFKRHMNSSIQRAKQLNIPFALILIDIDFFKKFNDTYGHQAGDEVLRCVAQKLKSQVRNVDVVCRYGGEEMAIVLDASDNDSALKVADKLVKAVAEEAYPIAEGVAKHVTISVGVATFPQHGKNTAELVEFADKGLYRAKEGGRNQVGAQDDTEEASA